MTAEIITADLQAELRELVRQHRVVYEVSAAEEMVGDRRCKIGFDVTLSGTHGAEVHAPLPGCEQCVDVWDRLQRIAQAVLPAPGRQSVYLFRVFDRALHSSPVRMNRNDVELVIQIRHQRGFLEPVDRCEEECLKDLLSALKQLGVPEAKWKESLSTDNRAIGNVAG